MISCLLLLLGNIVEGLVVICVNIGLVIVVWKMIIRLCVVDVLELLGLFRLDGVVVWVDVVFRVVVLVFILVMVMFWLFSMCVNVLVVLLFDISNRLLSSWCVV